MFPENLASLRLHERHGFRQVGVRTALGQMRSGPEAGHWRDVMVIECRSGVVGDAAMSTKPLAD